MRNRVSYRSTCCALAAIFILATGAAQVAEAQSADRILIDGLGALSFENTGAAEAQPAFIRGVLALHSFWYEEARRSFGEARQLDPGFALAYWGEAITHDQPIWGGHDSRGAQRVLNELESVDPRDQRRWTSRERLYLSAARGLFGSGSLQERRERFEERLHALSEQYPEDDEARAFHALLVIANNSHRGPGRSEILRAAARLEALLERNSEHPGAMHYIIHAYDHPDLVRRAVPIAEQYPDVAPAAYHAVHMPAHVYRQLGDWERVAELCKQAYDVSVRWVQSEGRPNTDRDFHSLQWLHTAYLQLGDLESARELHAHVDSIPAEGAERRRLNGIRASMQRAYRRAQR